jgi:DNA-binding CsgD family transcriptional regulator
MVDGESRQERRAERRGRLSVVPEAVPGAAREAQRGRRWDDHPGLLPSTTYAHFLGGRPSLDDAVRLLVALLCWPIGAEGAVIVAHTDRGLRIAASYVEQVSSWPPDLAGDEVPDDVAELVNAVVGTQPVLWTEQSRGGRRPMAAWRLGPVGGTSGVLVVFLATPFEGRLVTMRASSIAEILSVYFAGASASDEAFLVSSTEVRPGSESLSPRQTRILQLMSSHCTNPQIASRIGFSTSTVRMESLAIYRALGVHDRQNAVIAGRALGLVASEEI